MTRHSFFGIVCAAALIAGSADRGSARILQDADAAKKAPAATEEAAAAVKASPDLVNELSKEIGSTPLPPRFWLRYVEIGVRLIYPYW